MKVVLIGPYPLNIDKISGGIEAVIVYLLDGLRGIDDLNIQIVSCIKAITEEKIIEKDGVKVHYLPSSRRFGNITFGIVDRYRIKKKIRELNPDIVHSQNQTRESYAAIETGYPTVITVHGALHKEAKLNKGILNLIRRFPATHIQKICLRRSPYIMFSSVYVQKMFSHLTKSKNYLIENLINDKYFQIKNIEVPYRVLFIGPIIERKNILDLLKAVNFIKNELPEIKLHIVGVVREQHYFEILKDYIKDNRLESNVFFPGQVSEEQLLDEYGKCCLLALSSVEETSPMVIQQAMAAGKPVVGTRVGGIPYLVKNEETGFVIDCGDIKGLAEKIMLLLKDKNLRSKMGQKAKQEAGARFKSEVVARQTYDVYKEMLKIKIMFK